MLVLTLATLPVNLASSSSCRRGSRLCNSSIISANKEKQTLTQQKGKISCLRATKESSSCHLCIYIWVQYLYSLESKHSLSPSYGRLYPSYLPQEEGKAFPAQFLPLLHSQQSRRPGCTSRQTTIPRSVTGK